MGGGLMQLVAYGAQDIYLTGNPQITFFKVVYRRHTNFAVEAIQQTFNGNADYGRTVNCSINRNGDLITKMYLVVEVAAQTKSSDWGFCRRMGLALVESVQLKIGGSIIDEHYGDWLNIWYELSQRTAHARGWNKMVGDVPELTAVNQSAVPAYTMYVPMQFWFCRNNGLALPLIALQYHDVNVQMKFRDSAALVSYVGSAPSVSSLNDAYLLLDYVYLDSEERKRFAQASHEYLIEQLQFTGSESISATSMKYRLNFNHPSKYLVWVASLDRYRNGTEYVSTDRDRFAKLCWVASRANLNAAGTLIDVQAADEVAPADPGKDANLTAALDAIADKVEAQLLFAEDEPGVANANADADNVVLLRNDVTMEDMSKSVSDLVKAAGASDAEKGCKAFLEANGVVHRDHFNYGNYIDGSDNPCVSGQLQLNGHNRFETRDGHYFNYVQTNQHFSATPADGVNVYSFALNPEEHQPSGSCNFSRIDNTTLNVSLGRGNTKADSSYLNDYVGGGASSSTMNIYTVNYNVLRIMSGMGGLAYSN